MTKQVSSLWAAEVISRLLSSLAAIYVARILGVTAYGIVGFVGAITAYMLVLTKCGTDHLLVRELTIHKSRTAEDDAKLRSAAIVLRASLGFMGMACLIYLGMTAESAEMANLYWASIFSVASTIFPIEAFLQSEKQFSALAGFRIISNLTNILIILLFVRSPATSWVVPAAWGGGVLLTSLAFISRIRGGISRPSYRTLGPRMRFLAAQGLPLFGSMFLLLFTGQLSIILVKAYCSAEELGLYVAGYKIYDVSLALLVPVATVVLPNISGMWSRNDPDERARIVLRGISATLPVSLLILGSMLLAGKVLVPLILGDAFSSTVAYMDVLLVVILFRSTSMFFANGLVVGGRQRTHLGITAVVVVAHVVLSVLLIRSIGALGAAVAMIIAFVLECGLFVWASRDLFAVPLILSGIRRIAFPGISILLLCLGLLMVCDSFQWPGTICRVCLMIVFVAVSLLRWKGDGTLEKAMALW